MLMFESWQNRERRGERGIKKQVDHRGKQERDDKLRGGGVNKGKKKRAGVCNRWKDCGMGWGTRKKRRKNTWSSPVWSSHLRRWCCHWGCTTQWCWGLSNWSGRSLSLRNETSAEDTRIWLSTLVLRVKLQNVPFSYYFSSAELFPASQWAFACEAAQCAMAVFPVIAPTSPPLMENNV